MNAIVRSMKPGELYTIADIKECCLEVSELTNQRVSSLVRQIVPTRVVLTEKNQGAYFELYNNGI